MKLAAFVYLLFFHYSLVAQDMGSAIKQQMQLLENDEQFKHAAISFLVKDANSDAVVYERNKDLGLAPASCQKVMTSVAALSLLGQNFSFATLLHYNPSSLVNGSYNGQLTLRSNGDPTLGSPRYGNTASIVLQKWLAAIKAAGITKINGTVVIDDGTSPEQRSMPPRGYIWEDLGNYYGANSWALNWRENQYDVSFKTEAAGSKAKILSIYPEQPNVNFISTVTAAGTSDNAYINSAPYADYAYITGTIPPLKDKFTISGAMPRPASTLLAEFKAACTKQNLLGAKATFLLSEKCSQNMDTQKVLLRIESPKLDSVNYWFLKKSLNLYGECLLKQLGTKNTIESGVEALQKFYHGIGLSAAALNVWDGSGLSPANRITTSSLVKALQYAQKQSWYNSFYHALPIINDLHMKDGYISGVRSYAGYHKAINGKQYVFSFIVNNFTGSPSKAREKIWKILDLLK